MILNILTNLDGFICYVNTDTVNQMQHNDSTINLTLSLIHAYYITILYSKFKSNISMF